MEFNRELLVETFLTEASEGLQEMERSLLGIESNPGDTAKLNDVFRAAHTLKGNAAALGFDSLAAFAHVVEDLLEALRKHRLAATTRIISLLLKTVDALRLEVSAACHGEKTIAPAHLALQLEVEECAKAADVPSVDGAAAQATSTGTDADTTKRTLRVDISKLDAMLDLSGEIAIAQGRMGRLLREFSGSAVGELSEANREIEQLFKQLQEQVMNVRLVPIAPLFQSLLRPVRDMSHSIGKVARLNILGDEVEVDTRVYELLKDPLLHMVRNAIDHGIEAPDARQAAGKNRCGTLTLTARQSAGSIVIQLTDDGAGFDREKILAAARAAGTIADLDRLSDTDVFRLCFTAGLSTSSEVTSLSGRGVGMDVVQRNIDALRGKVEIDSKLGAGSTITIRLPLTLAIINGFGVQVADETFIIPMEFVEECMEMPNGLPKGNAEGVINLRGDALPFVRLRSIFDIHGGSTDRENVVVMQHENGCTGLAVDHLLGECQAIIKPLNRLFQNVAGVSGSTVLGDGRVALILDVNALIGHAHLQHQEKR